MMLVKSMIQDKLDATTIEAFDDVGSSLSRMQNMLKQFLMLADRNNEVQDGLPTIAEVSLKSMLDDVLSDLREQLSDDLKVENQLTDNLNVHIDRHHCREIFSLILGEVIGSTGGGAECRIYIDDSSSSELVKCCIQINGITVPDELHESIFEPFALPIANVGTGLSFAVAKHLMELNGSIITAQFPAEDQIVFSLELKSE